MFIRINPYLCHLLTRYQSTIFPNHKSCVRKKGVPDRNYRLVSYRDDTCAMYSFFDPMTELQRGTPRDQLQWVSEKVDGNSVRWTYRITNGDHDEAVRQTLERWAEKEDEEE